MITDKDFKELLNVNMDLFFEAFKRGWKRSRDHGSRLILTDKLISDDFEDYLNRKNKSKGK